MIKYLQREIMVNNVYTHDSQGFLITLGKMKFLRVLENLVKGVFDDQKLFATEGISYNLSPIELKRGGGK